MNDRNLKHRLGMFSLLAYVALHTCMVHAQLPEYQKINGERTSQEGAWETWSVDGSNVSLRVVNLVPRAEPKPALSIHLMPNEFHQKDGNAAIFYLQAMGFLEQPSAFKAKTDFERKNVDAALAADKSIDEVPPQSWLRTRPEDLPIEEVKEYLSYTSFQIRSLNEAVKRKRCDFDRQIREVENPAFFLLPEVQMMRGLARTQSLRFLLAMAENRTQDAVDIFGQQLAMGAHMSQEPFLVSNLVGIACAGMGWHDAFYLCEHEDGPNMYWAIAALPQPLVDMRQSMSYEREFLFEQVKILREVDATPRPDAYWADFVDRFYNSFEGLGDSFFPQRELMVDLAIAAGVPGAIRFLVEVEGMKIEELQALPNTQVFFLAVRRYYEHARDEIFKVAHLNHWEREQMGSRLDRAFKQSVEDYGLITTPSSLVLPAIRAAMGAQTRNSQQFALLRTTEAIRHHLAMNQSQLPASLEELELPAPLDPVSGKPFHYVRHTEGATLKGEGHPGWKYQIELRVKDDAK